MTTVWLTCLWHRECFTRGRTLRQSRKWASRPDSHGSGPAAQGVKAMLWTILVVLLVLWAIGLVANVGGGLIHLLLVIAAVVFLIQLLTGRRTVV
jgi:hypothetical protein